MYARASALCAVAVCGQSALCAAMRCEVPSGFILAMSCLFGSCLFDNLKERGAQLAVRVACKIEREERRGKLIVTALSSSVLTGSWLGAFISGGNCKLAHDSLVTLSGVSPVRRR